MWSHKNTAQATEGAGDKSIGQQHLRTLQESYHRLWRTPFLSFLTVLVIAAAWILPAQMTLLLQQGEAFLKGWPEQTQLMVYMKPELVASQVKPLEKWLLQHHQVAQVQMISPDEALAEFKATSHFQLDDLAANPLPFVFKIVPVSGQSQDLSEFKAQLLQRTDVDDVQLDEVWLRRMGALLDWSKTLLQVIALSLAIAVLLVIVSVVRLVIEGRREEIQVAKLIGATHAFIRRPFLYVGFWYGFLGGAVALILVCGINLWLAQTWHQVLMHFDASVEQVYPGFYFSLGLLSVSALLGMLGAWLAVIKHLKDVEPQ